MHKHTHLDPDSVLPDWARVRPTYDGPPSTNPIAIFIADKLHTASVMFANACKSLPDTPFDSWTQPRTPEQIAHDNKLKG